MTAPGPTTEYDFWLLRNNNRKLNPELPKTVNKFKTKHGSDVYVVGTAHFSRASEEDVVKTIQAVQPDVVVVELCQSRSSIMQLDEETLLNEAKDISLAKLRLSINQFGMMQGVVHILLLSISAQITKQLGMAPGGEFRTAYNEAKKIPGCKLFLGDRPINITLKRAISSLSLWNKVKFAWCLLFNSEKISKEDVEKYKEKDMLEDFLESMAGEYPELRLVFVDERDAFLTHSLKQAAAPTIIPNPNDPTQAVVVPKVVVGVVGMGHTIGIEKNWDKNIDIAPLLSIPNERKSGKVIKRIALASFVIVVSYGSFKLVQRVFV